MRHTVGKVSTRPTTLLQMATRSEASSESYEASKSRESRWAGFRDSRDKMAIWMQARPRVAEYTIRGKWLASPRGKVLASPPKGSEVLAHSQVRVWCVKASPSSPVAVPTQKGLEWIQKGVSGGLLPRSGPWLFLAPSVLQFRTNHSGWLEEGPCD